MALGRKTGGARIGSKWRKTLEKELVREHYRQKVAARFDEVVEAQIDTALGQYQVGYRDEQGRFRIAETDEELRDAQEAGKALTVYHRLASAPAQQDILNRMMDKPSESVQVNVSGEVTLVEHRLSAARKRHAERARG